MVLYLFSPFQKCYLDWNPNIHQRSIAWSRQPPSPTRCFLVPSWVLLWPTICSVGNALGGHIGHDPGLGVPKMFGLTKESSESWTVIESQEMSREYNILNYMTNGLRICGKKTPFLAVPWVIPVKWWMPLNSLIPSDSIFIWTSMNDGQPWHARRDLWLT